MKINVINYEVGYGENWIFSALAEKIAMGFGENGFNCEISNHPLPNYDIYFHISYGQANNLDLSKKHIVYITHIDDVQKLSRVIKLANAGAYCLCMSNDTAWRLNKLSNTDRFFGVLSPSLQNNENHSDELKLLFSYRIYQDGRKNTEDALFIVNYLSKSLKIDVTCIGSGWETIFENSNTESMKVKFLEFDRNEYKNQLSRTDYLIYTGLDEGAISVLDALVNKTKVIATAQGYHLDYLENKDLKVFSSRDNLIQILDDVIYQKNKSNGMYRLLTSWGFYCEKILERLKNN